MHFLPSSPHGLYLNQILSTCPDHPVNQRMKSLYRVSWCLLWLYLAIPDLVWFLQTCVNTHDCYRLQWAPCCMIVMDLHEHHIAWLLWTCMNTKLFGCYRLVWIHIVWLCGLNVYVHIKFVCWDPVLRWSAVRRWGSRVACGCEGGGLLNGISALTTVARERPLSASSRWRHEEGMAICNRQVFSSELDWTDPQILDFQTPEL